MQALQRKTEDSAIKKKCVCVAFISLQSLQSHQNWNFPVCQCSLLNRHSLKTTKATSDSDRCTKYLPSCAQQQTKLLSVQYNSFHICSKYQHSRPIKHTTSLQLESKARVCFMIHEGHAGFRSTLVTFSLMTISAVRGLMCTYIHAYVQH